MFINVAYKGCFNKDTGFLNVNKTNYVWDIYTIFSLFEKIFYGVNYGI